MVSEVLAELRDLLTINAIAMLALLKLYQFAHAGNVLCQEVLSD